jgi:hypothetical protein
VTHLFNLIARKPGPVPGLRVFLLLTSLLFAASPIVHAHSKESVSSKGMPVAAAQFDHNGRLWRLLIGQYHVFVDYSDEPAQGFSTPLMVNRQKQNILATAEDRPALAIADDGRMVVFFATNKPHTYSRYYSYSSDGLSFSQPQLISGTDKKQGQSQNRVKFTADGRLYMFWLQAHPDLPTTLAYSSTTALDKPMINIGTLASTTCDCCRLDVSLNQTDYPVVVGRFLFGENIRDIGMAGFSAQGEAKSAWRVSDDQWHINACPHHGPSLSIDEQNRQHVVWFTQGEHRKGLFYAQSIDQGAHFSAPMGFGNNQALASHADVLALGDRVVIVWREYDGEKTSILMIQSQDAGQHWGSAQPVMETSSDGDQPFLISDGETIYLSWNAADQGYQLVPLD